MTRQHFELVADLLHEIGDTLDLDDSDRRAMAWLAVRTLAATNGAFRADQFQARAILGPKPWAVVENTPGYLPDGDGEPATFATRREAERYAVELVGELRELGYRVTGSARVGTWHATNGSAHDLGRVVEVYDLATLL
jgi:hypothetical protein